MLIIRRKTEQTLRFEVPSGETIKVLVLAIEGDRVKLGIDAPREITVLREELLPRDPETPSDNA